MDHQLNHFYGFTRTPFGPVAGEVFQTRSHAKLVRDVVAEVFAGGVVQMIRGGVGVGKTSLMHPLANELRTHELCVVQIDSASQTPSQVLRLIAAARGIGEAGVLKPDQLFQRLRAAQAFDALVLIVDDSDALSVAMFRYLELLTELNHIGMINFHLVLIGRPGPWAGLVGAGLEGGRWAEAKQHFVCALGQLEAAAYLDHKFRCAGRSLHEVMTKAAAAELIDQAAGFPAELDLLTRYALLNGYLNGLKRITLQAVQQVLVSNSVTSPPALVPSPGWVPAIAATLSIVMAGAITLFVIRDVPAPNASRSPTVSTVQAAVSPAPAVVSAGIVSAVTGQPADQVDKPPVRLSATAPIGIAVPPQANPDPLPTPDSSPDRPVAASLDQVAGSRDPNPPEAATSPVQATMADTEIPPVMPTTQTPASDERSPPAASVFPAPPPAASRRIETTALGPAPVNPPAESAPTKVTAVAPALEDQRPQPDPQALTATAQSATPDPRPSAAIADSTPPDPGSSAVIAGSTAPALQPPAATAQSLTSGPQPNTPIAQSPAPDPRRPAASSDSAVQPVPREAWFEPPRSRTSDSPEPLVDSEATTPASPSAGNHGAPGLVLVAGAGDDLPTLYARVYRGLTPPPYPAVLAINRTPVKPGTLVTFPEPPGGWSARTDLPRHEEPTERRGSVGLAYQSFR